MFKVYEWDVLSILHYEMDSVTAKTMASYQGNTRKEYYFIKDYQSPANSEVHPTAPLS